MATSKIQLAISSGMDNLKNAQKNLSQMPSNVANQSVIILIIKVASDAISNETPCKLSSQIVLISVLPIPPGSIVNAPNKPPAVCARVAPIQST